MIILKQQMMVYGNQILRKASLNGLGEKIWILTSSD